MRFAIIPIDPFQFIKFLFFYFVPKLSRDRKQPIDFVLLTRCVFYFLFIFHSSPTHSKILFVYITFPLIVLFQSSSKNEISESQPLQHRYYLLSNNNGTTFVFSTRYDTSIWNLHSSIHLHWITKFTFPNPSRPFTHNLLPVDESTLITEGTIKEI